MRVVKQQNNLPPEIVAASSLEVSTKEQTTLSLNGKRIPALGKG